MHSNFFFKVQSNFSQESGQAIQWVIPQQGGTVGRSSDCTWVLEDPNRIVSRQHARVDCESGYCHWTDLGTNSTQINGKPLSQGLRVRLNAGDVLKIGDYQILFDVGQTDWSGLDEFLPKPQEDVLESILPQASNALNIDDLLAELKLPVQPEFNEEPFHTPVLAERMYVGLQQAEVSQPIQALASPDQPRVHGENAQHVEQLTQLLKISVQGCMALLGARKIFQQEMGEVFTTISSKANNPLKFSVSADEALRRLLAEPVQGYLPADQALEQAYQDLLAHMQMSVAKIQALVNEVNTELNPQIIMDQAQHTGVFTLGLSNARKAKLWDIYCEKFKRLGHKWN